MVELDWKQLQYQCQKFEHIFSFRSLRKCVQTLPTLPYFSLRRFWIVNLSEVKVDAPQAGMHTLELWMIHHSLKAVVIVYEMLFNYVCWICVWEAFGGVFYSRNVDRLTP